MLGDASLAYGAGMARGLLLGGLTFDTATPPSVPEDLRSQIRPVPPYSHHELQQTLDFYAHVGHIQSRDLAAQLYSGKLMHKVHLMTAGIPNDVFKLCESM